MSARIYIELSPRQLTLKINNNPQHRYPVAIGKPTTPTPVGDFKILNKIKNPGGILGTRWIQFTRQEHGIHGTNNPASIGQAVSLGCVRMYNRDVEQLYAQVKVGTPIIIRNTISSGNPEYDQNKTYFFYKVKPGDSLWKLARRFNTTIEDIVTLNKLQGTIIYPGQKLKIPTSK